MNIPEEAVTALYQALLANGFEPPHMARSANYDSLEELKAADQEVEQANLAIARAALSAAAPTLMAMAWEEGRGALSIDRNPYRK